jgi:hypothetical protein
MAANVRSSRQEAASCKTDEDDTSLGARTCSNNQLSLTESEWSLACLPNSAACIATGKCVYAASFSHEIIIQLKSVLTDGEILST